MTKTVSPLISYICSFFAGPFPKKGSVGVLAIMKNESLNIREWVEHYKWQGVDKIFLIDNGSDDDTKRLIHVEIENGFIEYFWKPEPHMQTKYYQSVFAEASIRRKVEWLVIADLDEFWFSPSGSLKSAIELLSPGIDLIYTNWTVFGSGGYVEHPKSLREELVFRHAQLASHCNTKWICRTSSIRVRRAIGVHKVRWIDSRKVISENEIFKLNHYVTQSLHYFQEVKMKRGDAARREADDVRDMEYFLNYDAGAVVRDETLAEMVRSFSC